VDGFEGPLPWLLELARAQTIDLAKLSILGLVEAFIAALTAALAPAPRRRADLTSWAEWLLMAAQLAWLRSRLLLPTDAPEAKAAQAEAEALWRQVLEADAMRRAARWLEHRPQLGREVFGRGGPAAAPATRGRRGADLIELFQACLLVLRVPEEAEAEWRHRPPFWRVADAVARITRLLAEQPDGGELERFLPFVDPRAPERELRCRTALASTFVAGLELAREGAVQLEQPTAWQTVVIRAVLPRLGAA
jgi:segregation and condensation protein A